MKFIVFVVAVQHMFFLDFRVLMQVLGKFQKHGCLHASKMHGLPSTFQRSLEPPIFAYEFYHYNYTTLLVCHRPKLERMLITLIILKVLF